MKTTEELKQKDFIPDDIKGTYLEYIHRQQNQSKEQ